MSRVKLRRDRVWRLILLYQKRDRGPTILTKEKARDSDPFLATVDKEVGRDRIYER
ncbi:MAG: hypothetical protein SW833_20500 [Cyanobacteriota bacterium]|nr:hypothetical protein [Cyanobacteriota bacterium]